MNKVIGYSAALSVATIVSTTSFVKFRTYYSDCLDSDTNMELFLNLSKSVACGTICYSTACVLFKIIKLTTETLEL